MQAARGVDEEKLGLLPRRCFERIVADRRGVPLIGTADHRCPGSFAPGDELFDRRRAECVAGGHHDRATLSLEQGRQLGNGSCLARAVDPDHQDDAHHPGHGKQRRQRRRKHGKEPFARLALHLGRRGGETGFGPQSFDQLRGHFDAEIRLEKHRLQLVPIDRSPAKALGDGA